MRILSKVSAYKIDFDEIECMCLMIKKIEKKLTNIYKFGEKLTI